MAELEQEDATVMSPVEEKTIAQEEKAMQEVMGKPAHKSIASISGANEPDSETSSLAPEDETTVANSETSETKERKAPRKLVEDEKRARGRIAWPVWRTYFTVSLKWD